MRVVLTVQERGDKQNLNTPGGDKMMAAWGGQDAGLPFYAFLDAKGTLLVNSIEPAADGRKAGNIGHPDAPDEVDWFLAMLTKAAPRMTAQEKAPIEKYLRDQKK